MATAPTYQSVARRLRNLLEAGGALLCVATVAGYFGKFWWVLELASHFRVQYLLGLALVSVICFAQRRLRMGMICVAFALANAAMIAGLLWPDANGPPGPGGRVRLVAINVETRNERTDLVLDFLRKADADLVLLMEVDEHWLDALSAWRTNYPYAVTEPRDDNFGIALFSHLPLTNAAVLEIGEAGVPSITAEFHLGDRRVAVLGTHPLPPGSAEYARLRNEQLGEIAAHVRTQTLPVIVLGDLNATPWSPWFSQLLREAGLKNSAQGRGLFASWPAWLPLARIPLDHCLVSPGIEVVERRVGDSVGSDHLPMIVDLRLSASRRNPTHQQP